MHRRAGIVADYVQLAEITFGVGQSIEHGLFLREPTMPALAIRDDIGSEELRRRARRERDGRISARLIAIANALAGMDRASAARLAGMDRQTLRDWVHRYNAEGVPVCAIGRRRDSRRRIGVGRPGRRASGYVGELEFSVARTMRRPSCSSACKIPAPSRFPSEGAFGEVGQERIRTVDPRTVWLCRASA